jgi:regulator of protease activity HflC (stomatin/prohibitin superfamily)
MSDIGLNFGGSLVTVAIVSFMTFIGCFIALPTILAILRQFGFYIVVEERRCLVYVLFGRVHLVLTEPGLHFPIQSLGWRALLVNFMGDVHEVDLRLDQEYLRSQAVNSEEGAPMGIGVWYEMWISDPVAYMFKNADPRGSLRANVGNATVRNLSNLKLASMLTDRHSMSAMVRNEVSDKSKEWGYSLGSVYIRKVHFRDQTMIQQIEEKVVNRLRQVTSAIRQDGINQVNLITSTAERQAAVEFAKAAAMRPFIVGSALNSIAQDEEVSRVMFEILENQKMLEGNVNVTLIPSGLRDDNLTSYLTANEALQPGTAAPKPSSSSSSSGAPAVVSYTGALPPTPPAPNSNQ